MIKRIHAEKALINLLNDPVVEVRTIARQALFRQSRGTDFGPDPRDSEAKIGRSIERWNNWLALQGPVANSGGSQGSQNQSTPILPREKKE